MLVAPLSPLAAGHRALRLPIRVYYEDTDAGGVVYYANYLKFCERARTEWLRQMGFGQARLMSENRLVFVVKSLQADYFRPAALDDYLEVLTRVEKLGRASIVFVQDVERDGAILFQLKVVIACVNFDRMKSAPIPADMHARMAATLGEGASAPSPGASSQ